MNYDHLKKEYEELTEKLNQASDASDFAKLGKRQSELLPLIEKITRIEKLRIEIAEHEKMIADKSELSDMAASELPALQSDLAKLEDELRSALLPKDPYDDKNIIIEIRAGAGGDES